MLPVQILVGIEVGHDEDAALLRQLRHEQRDGRVDATQGRGRQKILEIQRAVVLAQYLPCGEDPPQQRGDSQCTLRCSTRLTATDQHAHR